MVLTPHDMFAAIVKNPRPWGVLIVICLSVGGASGWLLGTDAGQQAAVARVVVPNIVQQLFVVPLNFTRGAIIGSLVMSRMGG